MSSPSRFATFAAIGDNIDRISALYSPFRSKSLNPEHFHEKQKFWIKSIEEYSIIDKRMVFSIKDLERAFMVQDKIAACLPDVVDHLRRTGTLVCEDEYKASLNSSETWWSWSTKPLKYVASTVWQMSPLKHYTDRKITKETRLVYVPQVLAQASAISNNSSLQNQLMTIEDWRDKLLNLGVEPDEITLLNQFLTLSKNLLRDKLGETEIVKLVDPNSKCGASISAAEKGKFDIIRTKEKLEQDLEEIFNKQHAAENQARAALKEGHRNTAKYHLRTKKTLEKRAEKLTTLIDNLTVITFQIEEAETDARILTAYEAGKKALSQVLQDNNMNLDRVTDVMLDMQEALEDQAEISAVVGRGVTLEDEDITSLEEELEQLLESEKKEPTTVSSQEISITDEETMKALEKLNLDELEDLEDSKVADKRPSQL